MSRGPTPPVIELTSNQEDVLHQILRTQTSPQNLVWRAKIILNAAEGKNNQQIAGELQIFEKRFVFGATVGYALASL